MKEALPSKISQSDWNNQSTNITGIKNYVLTAITLLISLTSIAQSYTGYSNNPAENDGSTEAKSINIYTAGDLIYLSKTSTDWGKYFVLMADIDFGSKESVDWDNDGSATWDAEDQLGFSPIGNSTTNFTGTFKSTSGNIISNLYINRTTDNNGLFGFIGIGAYISKIGIENAQVTGRYYNGTLAGQIVASEAQKAYISECYSAGGTVSGKSISGGLIGEITLARLTNCYACVSVRGSNNYNGGLVGNNGYFSSISNCYASGLVQSTYYYYLTGGLTCRNYEATVNNSYWDKETSKQSTSVDGIGLTTADFCESTNFSGWDFTSTWQMGATNEDPYLRPRLKWQVIEDCVSPYNVKVDSFTDGNVTFSWTDISYATEKWAVEYGTVGFTLGEGTKDTVDINSYTISGLNIGEGIDLYVKSICTGDNNSSGWTAPCSFVALPSGGFGTLVNPYRIGTIQDLDILSKQPSIWSTHFILINDIDASETKTSSTFNNGGLGFSPIGNSTKKFTGTFKGKGHVISNLYINRNQFYVGLFGYVGSGVRIDSLGLENVNISNQNYHTGALIGYVDIANPIIFAENSYVAGGVVEGYYDVGGLVGRICDRGIITNCYSSVTVKCSTAVYNAANSGGFIGTNSGGNIINCYSGGAMDAIDGNGLARYCGIINAVTSSYWDKEISGKTTGWGEYSTETAGVEFGLTTAEFAQDTNFTDWDFTNVWQIGAIKFDTYQRPRLKWQGDRIGLISRYRVSPSNSGTILGDTLQVTNANVLPSEVSAIPNAGYHFVEWRNQLGDSITNINPLLVNVISDTLLIAVLDLNSYELVFNPNSGNGSMENQTITYTHTATLPLNLFTRTGYTFAGWSNNPNGSVEYTDEATYTMQTAANDTLYAQWTPNNYDVVFDANGGNGNMQNQTTAFNSTVALNSNTFTRTGYTFLGWSRSTDGSVEFTDGANYSMLTATNDTLYAKWAINSYDVVFIANSGEGDMVNQTIVYSSTAALNNCSFLKTGYSFAGWANSANGEIAYTDGADYTMQEASNDTLYAQWTANYYDIVFIPNNGEGVMTNQSIAYNSTVALKNNEFTRHAYTFKGWSTKLMSYVEYEDGDNYTMQTTENDTLYAQWTLNSYDVVFIANGGEGVMPNQTILYGRSDLLFANTFTRNGYTFKGWSTDVNGNADYADGSNYTMYTLANDTLYAQWTPNNYDVVFIANGGEGSMANQTIPFNSTASLKNNSYTKTGYSFAGWATSTNGAVEYTDGADYSMLTTVNDTLYSQWTANYYDIVFVANGGEGSMSNQPIAYSFTTPLISNMFTKTGYSFAGWATSTNGTIDYTDGASYTMLTPHNDTLYAQWTVNYYDIIFISNGGEGNMPNQSIAYNTTAALNNNVFTKTGYTFGGWATSEIGAVEYANGTNYTMLTASDVLLYAHWDINSGVETSEINNLTIYPNPVSTILTIKTEKDCTVELIDINGRVIVRQRIENGTRDLPMNNQPAGNYILRVIYDTGIVTRQIVKN
ncbi:hypothetical protein CYCD_24520 [Tenuifilaceae bacterium CYCD]|nr:hypothetical protein CYCD_24520 [Tenuifilaceae bacterium CYCD]